MSFLPFVFLPLLSVIRGCERVLDISCRYIGHEIVYSGSLRRFRRGLGLSGIVLEPAGFRGYSVTVLKLLFLILLRRRFLRS